jgi:hypothetical protein
MTCNPLVRWLERSFQLLGDLRLRALNLVWSLVESDFISCRGNGASKKKIAIVGGGFVGPTIAAGLIEKDVSAEITIFEERDTLLPLQQATRGGYIRTFTIGRATQYDDAGIGLSSGRSFANALPRVGA